MNTALEELLEVRASMDCHCRELDLGVELAVYHNDAQLAKAKTCHIAAALQWTHLDSVSALNHEPMAEEGQNTKLSQRSSQQPSETAHQKTNGHLYTLYNY